MTEETVESNAKTQGGQPPPLQQTYNSKIFLSLSCLCQNCPGFIFFVTDFQWIPFFNCTNGGFYGAKSQFHEYY